MTSTCLVQVRLHGQVKDGMKDGIDLPENDSTQKCPYGARMVLLRIEKATVPDDPKEFIANKQNNSEDRIEEWRNPDTTEEYRQAKALEAEEDERTSKIPVKKEDAAVEAEILEMMENEFKRENEWAKKQDEDNDRVKARNEALKKRLYG